MPMTPEQLAEVLADEMLEDFENYTRMALYIENRWKKNYGPQFWGHLSDMKVAEVNHRLRECRDLLEAEGV